MNNKQSEMNHEALKAGLTLVETYSSKDGRVIFLYEDKDEAQYLAVVHPDGSAIWFGLDYVGSSVAGEPISLA